MSVDMSKSAVSARLSEVGSLSDLRAANRLATKVDMSPHAVTRRLRKVGEALELCRRLGARVPVQVQAPGAAQKPS